LVALLPPADWIPPLAQAKPILLRAAAVSPRLRFGLGVSFAALLIALLFLFSSHNAPETTQNGMTPTTDDREAPRLSPGAPAPRP
jgi:hypothetical protein